MSANAVQTTLFFEETNLNSKDYIISHKPEKKCFVRHPPASSRIKLTKIQSLCQVYEPEFGMIILKMLQKHTCYFSDIWENVSAA